jgi:hypothetical protein
MIDEALAMLEQGGIYDERGDFHFFPEDMFKILKWLVDIALGKKDR